MNYGSPIVLMYDVVWSRARTRYYCVLMIRSTINHAAKMRVVDWQYNPSDKIHGIKHVTSHLSRSCECALRSGGEQELVRVTI